MEIIRWGISAGEFKSGTKPEDIAWQLLSIIEGALLISTTLQHRKLGRQLLDQGKKLISQVTIPQNS